MFAQRNAYKIQQWKKKKDLFNRIKTFLKEIVTVKKLKKNKEKLIF